MSHSLASQALRAWHTCIVARLQRFVVFGSIATNFVAGDTNALWDVFVHDRQASTTIRVSVDSAGGEVDGNSFSPAISGNGRYVAFRSLATNLVTGDSNGKSDIFVHDLSTAQTTRASIDSSGLEGNGDSLDPVLSADGRWLAFYSYATNLVVGDTNAFSDVFVHDRQAGSTTRVRARSPFPQA